jgi:CBS-domain-containing membrane protein
MIVGSIAAIGALLVLVLIFGSNLDYRFEVAAIAINCTVLIVAGILLGVLFRRNEPTNPAVR